MTDLRCPADPEKSVASPIHWGGEGFQRLLENCRRHVALVQDLRTSRIGLTEQLNTHSGRLPLLPHSVRLLGLLPPLYPEWLGDRSFSRDHGVRFPYIAGAMAHGIASISLVRALTQSGFMAFFGAAGLDLAEVEHSARELSQSLSGYTGWGMNLIYSPQQPGWEDAVVECYLRYGVRKVSASAYMRLTPALVRYACKGLTRREDGRIFRPNALFAKVSRTEVATAFMKPAPQALLDFLVQQKKLTPDEAQLARSIPLAQDITAEADSGGHTDNQSMASLVPVLSRMAAEMSRQYGYSVPLRVGAAGGLGTPASLAAAFGMGASYVLTGSVNQSCAEAGISDLAKSMLMSAELKDMQMAPAADMFGMGVQVQVLAKGTLFPVRARKLYRWYRQYAALSELPSSVRTELERDFFRQPLDEAWEATRCFWELRDRNELRRAEEDSHHQMALLFRSYLGLAGRWALSGDRTRQGDYQIWCGPAQAAFNDWIKGSFLEDPEQRTVVQVAKNLMEGAAVLTRMAQFRSFGVPVCGSDFSFRPRPLT
ncbi:MAG: PfaD family polyunsaturated fatty acid/polyketide biosynthesis protein [Deltaproteobacteria bacterium]|nr:PfaD family polyunsaturated fatty acid/polyketide biosynthesis protein [Deltaproteobacteria bacterium]